MQGSREGGSLEKCCWLTNLAQYSVVQVPLLSIEHGTYVVYINVRSSTVLEFVTMNLRDAIATYFTLVFGDRWSNSCGWRISEMLNIFQKWIDPNGHR